MKKIGAYIHIPFCKRKCFYCDFLSFENAKNIEEKYIQALINEIEAFRKKNSDIQIQTLYIGGGTPSYIESNCIREILSKFNIDEIEEVTIELNPGTVNREKIKDYKESGINRLSIGLQSTDDNLLKQIGRIHTYKEFLSTYNLAKEAGFNNINVDLMIGLPGQTIKNVKDFLEKITKLDLKHISVYSLIIEEETKMYKMLKDGKIELPSEETERNMYWYAKRYLEINGFKHYEISNFSKNGFESKHNLDCWNQKEYIGFGIGAHSYIDSIRFSNIDDINNYIKNIDNRCLEKNRIIQEKQNEEIKQKEYIMLGLRKIEGISIQKFKNKFAENPLYIYRNELSKLVEQGLICIDEDKIKLTNKGLDFANQVWQEFV